MIYIKTYLFDPLKHDRNYDYQNDGVFLLQNFNEKTNKKSKSHWFFKGQVLKEKEIVKLGVSKADLNKFFVPVEIEKDSIYKSEIYGQKVRLVKAFGKKPKILGNYKPNKLNKNLYQ